MPKALKAKDFGKKSVCRNSTIATLLSRAEYIEKKSGDSIPINV
ncbi:hypothetical protein KKA14_12635 [bacterium]|nr:hypothetical protein [bacterium]